MMSEQPSSADSFAHRTNEFAIAMYGALRRQPGNVVFSPLGIRIALAMAHAGARGQTAAQMSEVLHASFQDEREHATTAAAIQRLNTRGRNRYELAIANSLWVQDGTPLGREFLDVITRHYSGGVNQLDFRHSAENVRAAINQWVEDSTRQRIRQPIPPHGLGGDTRLVLANAIYFKGRWGHQFNEAVTREGPFFLESGESVQVPLMVQTKDFLYLRAADYQAVEMLYRGDDLSMLVLLPAPGRRLRDLEDMLSAALVSRCVARMEFRQVSLCLPRFTITCRADLRRALTALGMALSFNRLLADFSGINGRQAPHEEALFLSAVLHNAFVEVKEEGTEAAAFTGLGGQQVMGTPDFFCADRPFVFAIRERETGALLFLGRVTDPR
jgi:serpin B